MLKLLHATVLSVTFVGYVIASHIFGQYEMLESVRYIRGPELDIVQSIPHDRHSQVALIDAISIPELLCAPKMFLDRLDEVRTPKGQESAVRIGIDRLFDSKRTDCIRPLLAALEGRELLSKRLKDIAIQEAFKNGAKKRSEYWVKDLYDDPAITPEVYASGLAFSGWFEAQDPVFKWLLATASRKDLQAVRDNDDHLDGFEDFRVAFSEALSVAKPDKARVGVIGPRAKAVKKIVSEVMDTSEQGFVEIIGAYVAEEIGECDGQPSHL